MKLKSIAGLIIGAVVSVLLWGVAPPVRAALCGKCQDLMFTESQGKCIDCGGPTASAALQLCPKCSGRRRQCEHCLAKLGDKDASAAESPLVEPPPANGYPGPALGGDSGNHSPSPSTAPDDSHPSSNDSKNEVPSAAPPRGTVPDSAKTQNPGAMNQALPPGDPNRGRPQPDPSSGDVKYKPINPARAGAYSADKWRFQLQITDPGTRNEGRWGWLTYDGQKLPRGNINDYYLTPWGPMYWVDVPKTSSGLHGFMPIPLPQNPRSASRPAEDAGRPGRALALPASLTGGKGDSPGLADPAPGYSAKTGTVTAPAPAPAVQTLEVNRSHNGQLARLRVGNVLIIRLPGNPASGYQWQAVATNTPALQMTVRPQYSPPASATAGPASPGSYTFVYRAVQPGMGALRLYYVRPGDTRAPRDAFAIGVNVTDEAQPR